MAKKIKQKKVLTREEQEALRQEQEEAKLREQAGIEDEFQAKGFEFAEWAQHNSHIVLGILGVIILAGAVTFGVQTMQRSKAEDASRLFSDAHTTYVASLGDAPGILTGEEPTGPSFKDAKERATAARTQFQAVVDDYGGTGAASMAALYVGHASMTLEDYDGASAAYLKFLDSTSRTDPLRFLALDGLATALEAKGDDQGAITRLEELIALPGKVSEDAALLRAARLYRKLGQNDKARERAERLVSEFSTSPLKADAEEVLASVKTGTGEG